MAYASTERGTSSQFSAATLQVVELAGYDDPHALILEGFADAPHAFAWGRL